MAFGVDEVLHEQEILVKSLGTQLQRVPNIAGATVLGNSRIIPIINSADLILTAQKCSLAVQGQSELTKKKSEKSILIAEDSITTRTLLKKILTSEGYKVYTAVDGMDALNMLHRNPCHLLISDIEMPRMNGLELVSRLRKNPRYIDFPVILVTGLTEREHREKGLQVGANAYLGKDQFDDQKLLKLVRQLI
jgi:two-component system chemotaxis sensor kinase CheA